MFRLVGILCIAEVFMMSLDGAAPPQKSGDSRLVISVTDRGERAACRLRVDGPLPQDATVLHNVCRGQVELAVSPGIFRVTATRGPEYRRSEEYIRVEDGQTKKLQLQLERLTDLAQHGWWSGDTHVHLSRDLVALHMLAEDLHLVPLLSWWNRRQQDLTSKIEGYLIQISPNRVCYLGNQEQEPSDRGGGTAVLFFDLLKPVDYDENLAAASERAKRQRAWVEIEKPYVWDTPALLAAGGVDFVEIAPNILSWWLRDDFKNYMELGWGRPRDAQKYPGLKGYGFYVQDLYYQILNCGFRIAPTAGTACGVKDVPFGLGYNRVYVHLDSQFTWNSWWESLAAGRAFVTNGPLLRVKANGALPGEVFRSRGSQSLQIDFDVVLEGRDPIETVEVIKDGKVVQTVNRADLRGRVSLNQVRFDRSGWFLVQARTGATNTLCFASTAPFYVEVGDHPRTIDTEAAEFFRRWAQRRHAEMSAAYQDHPRKDYYLSPHRRAVWFFEALRQGEVYFPTVEPKGRDPEVVISGPSAVGDLRLWVPETIAGDRGMSALYPIGEEWKNGAILVQQVREPGIFGPRSHEIDSRTIECGGVHFPRESGVEWRTRVTSGPNRVDFSIRLTNTGKAIIRKAGAAVCLRFLQRAFWREETTYVLSGGRVTSLAELGRKAGIAPDFEAYLLRGVRFPNVFYTTFWGFNPRELDRPMIVSHNLESGWSVAITGERAYFLHSNKGGPCTDIMLAFGDLQPAESAESHGSILIQRTRPDLLLREETHTIE